MTFDPKKKKLLWLLVMGLAVGAVYYFFFRGPEPLSLKGPFLIFENPPTNDEKTALIQALHARLNQCKGPTVPSATFPSALDRLKPYTNPFQLRVWIRGKKIFLQNVYNQPFEKSFLKILSDLCARPELEKVSEEGLKQVQIEFAWAYGLTPLDPKFFEENKKRLESQMGLFGLFVQKEGRWIYPAEFARKGTVFRKLFNSFCQGSAGECLDSNKGGITLFYAFHFVEDPLTGSALDLFRLHPVLSLQQLTTSELENRIALLGQWFSNNLRENGSLPYLYVPSRSKYPKEKNALHYWVREWMATWSLLRLAEKDPTLSEAAEKNLQYNLGKTLKIEEEKKIAYNLYKGTADLGSASGALMGLLLSKTHPDREKLIRYYSNFIQSLQGKDGKFKTFYLPESRDDNQSFYPGEAMLALMTLYEKNPKMNPRIPSLVDQSFRYYREYFRKQPEPAFVPWQTQALYKLYKARKRQEYADFIFEMNDFLVEEKRTSHYYQKLASLEEAGRNYDPKEDNFGWAPASIVSAGHTEGLVYALKLALEKKDAPRIKSYSEALRLWMKNLFQLQYTSQSDFFIAKPKRVLGALRISDRNGNIQIDNLQHATGAFLNVLSEGGVVSLLNPKPVPETSQGTSP